MRKKLKNIGDDERHTFTGEFIRFGTKNGWVGEVKTLLLGDVKMGDDIVTDHLWFDCGKSFERLDLKEGDIVQFDARVAKYEKGYRGWRDDVFDKPPCTDWKLSRPTKVRKISSAKAEEAAEEV